LRTDRLPDLPGADRGDHPGLVGRVGLRDLQYRPINIIKSPSRTDRPPDRHGMV
jgi:hypothetical protein